MLVDSLLSAGPWDDGSLKSHVAIKGRTYHTSNRRRMGGGRNRRAAELSPGERSPPKSANWSLDSRPRSTSKCRLIRRHIRCPRSRWWFQHRLSGFRGKSTLPVGSRQVVRFKYRGREAQTITWTQQGVRSPKCIEARTGCFSGAASPEKPTSPAA
jgi:hypothetical protein